MDRYHALLRERAANPCGPDDGVHGPRPAEATEAVCTCYPEGVSPETYEGPQEWCEVHGQARAVLIQHRDAARALVDTLRAEVEKARYEADMNRAGYEHVQAQIEALRAAAAAAERRLNAVKALHQPDADLAKDAAAYGITRISCPGCGQPSPCPTARAAAVATPDATREGDPSA